MTRTVLAVFSADTHLQPAAWTSEPELCGDALYSFEQLCAQAAHYGVPLILGGDIFDRNRPDPQTVAAFVRTLQQYNIRLLYVQGDHDYDQTEAWPSLYNNAIALQIQAVNLNPRVCVAGVDFHTADKLPAALARVPPQAALLVTHQAWGELRPVGATAGRCSDLVPGHIRYVLSGDTHLYRQMQTTNAAGGQVTLVSPGSTCMQDIGEPSDKVAVLVCEDSTNTAAPLEFVPVPLVTRRMQHVHLLVEADLNEFCRQDWARLAAQQAAVVAAAGAPVGVQKPILRVSYMSTLTRPMPRIQAAVGNSFFLFLSALAPEQETGITVTAEMLAGHATARDELAAVANAVSAPGSLQHGHILKLLSATDKKDVDRLVTEVVEEFTTQFTEATCSS